MITTKPLKATCVDGDRHRRHGDACLARDRRGRALCVLCAEAKFRDSDDAPTTTERLALCGALADVAADASSQNDAIHSAGPDFWADPRCYSDLGPKSVKRTHK